MIAHQSVRLEAVKFKCDLVLIAKRAGILLRQAFKKVVRSLKQADAPA